MDHSGLEEMIAATCHHFIDPHSRLINMKETHGLHRTVTKCWPRTVSTTAGMNICIEFVGYTKHIRLLCRFLLAHANRDAHTVVVCWYFNTMENIICIMVMMLLNWRPLLQSVRDCIALKLDFNTAVRCCHGYIYRPWGYGGHCFRLALIGQWSTEVDGKHGARDAGSDRLFVGSDDNTKEVEETLAS